MEVTQTNIGCREHVVLDGTVKTCRSRTRELLTEIRRCSSSRAGRDTLSAVQVRPGFASLIEDGLQSNTGCLMRATQLSRKSATLKKNEVFRGTIVRCVPRWLEAGESPAEGQESWRLGSPQQRGKCPLCAKVTWCWESRLNISVTTGSGADCVSGKVFAERLQV